MYACASFPILHVLVTGLDVLKGLPERAAYFAANSGQPWIYSSAERVAYSKLII
jgi:hypothetical protein